MRKCINCNHDISLNYCENCGQSADTSKIDWKFCSKELFYNNFTFHNKTMNTLLGLLKNPGLMIRNYLAGKRIGHIGAIQLLFFALVIHGILTIMFNEPGKASGTVLDINDQHIDLQKYIKSMIVLFILLSSYGTKITYKKFGFTFPEHLVLNFYIISFTILISDIVKLITWNKLSDYSLFSLFLITLTYLRVFYKPGHWFKSILQAVGSALLILFFSFIAILIFSGIIALFYGITKA